MRRRLIAALATTFLVALGFGGQARADQPVPRLSVMPGLTKVGGIVTVTGSGLPGSALFTVQVCGNNARSGTVDCATLAAQTVVTSPLGVLSMQLKVARPPTACPCVVLAWSTQQPMPYMATIALKGMPALAGGGGESAVAAPQSQQTSLSVTNARMARASWLTWLGVQNKRRLTFTVTNSGSSPAPSPLVQLSETSTVGATRTLAGTQLDDIPPHTTKTVVVPVDLGSIALGVTHVTGSVTADGQPTSFALSTSSVPWAWIILILFLAHRLVLRARNRVRHGRYARRATERSAPRHVAPASNAPRHAAPEWSAPRHAAVEWSMPRHAAVERPPVEQPALERLTGVLDAPMH
jgi:hypothetical protein